jgi:RimJ/RimL family protein N-acetyltransferase
VLNLLSNDPIDLVTLSTLLTDKDDLFLVWPEARLPFDPEQWREKLQSRPGNRSYFVAYNDEIIGHAALLETDDPHVLAVSYLFIRPRHRGRGFGTGLIRLLEDEARKISGTQALRLRVRTYNPRAIRVYEASGFVASEQEGTLLVMRKTIAQV